MFVIVRSGNKQYRVEKGDRIQVERLPHEAGAEVTLSEVLLLGDGDQYKIDKQALSGVAVSARVLGEHKGRKVISFDYRNKHRRRTTHGHRQLTTDLEITDIVIK
ncbi:MAG: 50S ribosomal protein L21 [Anaerolineae bacterium]